MFLSDALSFEAKTRRAMRGVIWEREVKTPSNVPPSIRPTPLRALSGSRDDCSLTGKKAFRAALVVLLDVFRPAALITTECTTNDLSQLS